MKAAVFTSVSKNISELARLTIVNKADYCLRHGYSLIADNLPYQEAVVSTNRLANFLETNYDIIWTLDADTVITDMDRPFHDLACLGPHVTVCEEGIIEWNKINCGSLIWKNTFRTRWLLNGITANPEIWSPLPGGWQFWLALLAREMGDLVTIAPLRSFNSCEWTHPNGQEGTPGSHWQPGDFLYHPCGVFPPAERLRRIREKLALT